MTRLLSIGVCVLMLSLQIWTATATTSWWLIGVAEPISNTGDPANCDQLNRSLTDSAQSQFCQYNKENIGSIALGSRKGIVQCQIQFAKNRWNCSTFNGDDLFGKFINDDTRETAFVNSMLAASAGLEIASACREEKLPNCTCKIEGENGIIDGVITTFKCSYDAEKGKQIVNEFLQDNVDPGQGTEFSEKRKIEIHNHNVGLQTIQNRTLKCRCSGLSGSCTVQSCYPKSPDIETIGEQLKSLYDGSVKVEEKNGNLVPENSQVTLNIENNTELIHKGDSPSFCESDYSNGVVGTERRECDNSGTGPGSCSVMCCERGTYSISIDVPVECCQFVWCCRVECNTCRVDTIVKYYCNP